MDIHIVSASAWSLVAVQTVDISVALSYHTDHEHHHDPQWSLSTAPNSSRTWPLAAAWIVNVSMATMCSAAPCHQHGLRWQHTGH